MHYPFAYDSSHYARLLTIHNSDLLKLPEANPSVKEEFTAERFVIYRMEWRFSNIWVDQAHEQNDALIMNDWEAVGIT